MAAKIFSRDGSTSPQVGVGGGLAYRWHLMDYVDAENEAKRGMWRGTFVKPWEWHLTAPPRPQASVPSLRPGGDPRQDAADLMVIVQTFAQRVGAGGRASRTWLSGQTARTPSRPG